MVNLQTERVELVPYTEICENRAQLRKYGEQVCSLVRIYRNVLEIDYPDVVKVYRTPRHARKRMAQLAERARSEANDSYFVAVDKTPQHPEFTARGLATITDSRLPIEHDGVTTMFRFNTSFWVPESADVAPTGRIDRENIAPDVARLISILASRIADATGESAYTLIRPDVNADPSRELVTGGHFKPTGLTRSFGQPVAGAPSSTDYDIYQILPKKAA